MPQKHQTLCTPLAAWVLLCAFLNATGWILSSFGQLNALGYGLSFIAIATIVAGWWVLNRPRLSMGFRIRRFKRVFPFAFAAVAMLAFTGGLVHAPNNYDALAYRIPRILHWLAEDQWHWIHTDFQRLNTRGCGIEWVSAPLLLFTGSDRYLFLINIISFLLLPGLSYSILTGLGVRNRVAWHWMWVFPTGYCYVLQAGSIGNDLFGATLVLSAIDFALRAARTHSVNLAWLSILAAALMTAGKGFNLLLLLPWGLALLPATYPLIRRPLVTFLVGIFALLISLLPTALLNARYCGDWKGISAEPVNLGTGEPLLHLGINAILISLHNLNPTFNPVAGVWNRWIELQIPPDLAIRLSKQFEDSGAKFKLGEMQMEEVTGLGFGVTLLLLPVLFGALRRKQWISSNIHIAFHKPSFLVPAGAWLVMIYFFTQSGLGCPARYLAPSYILLLAPLLCSHQASQVLKYKWWRYLAIFGFFSAFTLIIATPSRPLWPAQTLLGLLNAESSNSIFAKRISTVYSVYGARSDGFSPAKDQLPSNLNRLGFVTFDDPETSLWKPFGTLRIEHVTRQDNADSLRRRNLDFVLVSEYIVVNHEGVDMQQWLSRCDAEIIRSFDLTLRATRGPTRWHLVRVRRLPREHSIDVP